MTDVCRCPRPPSIDTAVGSFGAKSVAEVPIAAVAPAVRNATLDATGVALDALPLTPERVWRPLSRSI